MKKECLIWVLLILSIISVVNPVAAVHVITADEIPQNYHGPPLDYPAPALANGSQNPIGHTLCDQILYYKGSRHTHILEIWYSKTYFDDPVDYYMSVEVKLSDGTILSDVANLIGQPKFTTPSLIFHLPLDD